MLFTAIIGLVTVCWAQAVGNGVQSLCSTEGQSCIAGQPASSLLQKQSLSKSFAAVFTEEPLKAMSMESHGPGSATMCSSDAVIAREVTLDESGFQQVAASCCHQDMKEFVRRAVYDMDFKVCDEGGLSGIVPFYACPETDSSFGELQAELRAATTSTCHWLAPGADECTPPAAECAVIISHPAPAAEPAVTGFFGFTASNPLELVRNAAVVDTVKSELAGALEVSKENVNVVIATSTLGLTLLQGNSVFTSLVTGTTQSIEPNCTVYAVFSVQDNSASFLQQGVKGPINVARLLSILRALNWPEFFVRLVAALLRVAPRANGLEVTERSQCVQGSTCERDVIKPAINTKRHHPTTDTTTLSPTAAPAAPPTTTTTTVIHMCAALGAVPGYDVSDCAELASGQECKVPCLGENAGADVTFKCTSALADGHKPPALNEEASGGLLQRGLASISERENRLLQGSMSQVSSSQSGKDGVYPRPSAQNLIAYFMSWSKGQIRNSLLNDMSEKDLLLEFGHQQAQLSEAVASENLRAMKLRHCAGQNADTHYAIVQQQLEKIREFHVVHMLLRDEQGRIQYAAMQSMPHGQVRVHALQPHICKRTASLVARGGVRELHDNPEIIAGSAEMLPGGTELLAPHDPLRLDCEELFHATVKESCQRDMILKVLSARSEIIAGVAVILEAKICDSHYQCYVHHPKCVFQTEPTEDPVLLQKNVSLEDEPLKGLAMKITMHTPICEADKRHGVDPSIAKEADLMEIYSMGENSRYKGHEHDLDGLPRWGALQSTVVPTELDLRSTSAACFPAKAGMGAGTEVVRNQGTCGSCWAFASATATMNTLCLSKSSEHSLRSASDRYEISTQNVMSCLPEGESTQKGCSGGNMADFDGASRAHGLAREANNPYRCGGGDSLNHFDETDASCDAFPWGGSCFTSADPSWFWGGAGKLNGEDLMKSYLARGTSLYASFTVYSNFLSYSSGVYSATAGSEKGGHAVTLIGYGAESGVEYWLVQNSWGTGWGLEGFAKFKRGENLAGIEDGAFAVRAWVEGAAVPACEDSSAGSGLSSGGSGISCEKAANVYNLCDSPDWGPTVSKNCMKSCNSPLCSGTNGGAATSTPNPSSSTKYELCLGDFKSKMAR